MSDADSRKPGISARLRHVRGRFAAETQHIRVQRVCGQRARIQHIRVQHVCVRRFCIQHAHSWAGADCAAGAAAAADAHALPAASSHMS